MKAASVQEIKAGLKDKGQKELVELCLRLARYKKENKELLSFLLFEEENLPTYISGVNELVDETFAAVNVSSVHFAKKTIRRALRIANKHIRYTGSKTAEVEILLHYCTNFKGLKLAWQKSVLLSNIYRSQLKKIEAALATMHEDLQYDYRRSLKRLLE